MAKDANVFARVDASLKEEAEGILSQLGMPMSNAINVFLNQVVLRRGLPFEVTLGEPNETTYQAMEAAEKEQDIYGPFDSVAELMEALNA